MNLKSFHKLLLEHDRRIIRVCFFIIVFGSGISLGASYASNTFATDKVDDQTGSTFVTNETQDTWDRPEPQNVTVVTSQNAPFTVAKLIAVDREGRILYFNDTYYTYYDVDPSPKGRWTVMYTAAIHLNRSECHASTKCRRNVVERVNLSTGEVTRIYNHTVPYPPKVIKERQQIGPIKLARNHLPQSFTVTARWHDVDRIGESRLLVGDIGRDRVFIVNTTTGIIKWEWQAQSDFPFSGGGEYPYDWTHLNDVELLDGGRIMVSLRNQDQVVFLDRETGLQSNWTLGAEDEYEILYEQHNPDYIPDDQGGPAVIVSDSENNRVVEYQRHNHTWNQTWVWTDDQMTWPRDADRLPSGNTIIVDTGADRVIEVNRNGSVVWRLNVRSPYDVERLNTDAESGDGPSAVAANIMSTTLAGESSEPKAGQEDIATRQRSFLDIVESFVRSLVPNKLWNGLIFILPRWMHFYEVFALFTLLGSLTVWSLVEYRWSSRQLRLQLPVRFEED